MLFAKNLLLDKLGVNGSTPTHPKIPELQPSSSGSKKLGVDKSRGDERIQLWNQHNKPAPLCEISKRADVILLHFKSAAWLLDVGTRQLLMLANLDGA